MKFINYDRVVCLCVDYRYEDEWPRVQSSLRDLGVLDARAFVNGRGDILPTFRYNQFNLSAPPATWRMDGIGSFNHYCALRSILKKAASDGIEHLLFLEDDVEFSGDFAEREALVAAEVPDDWDLLYYGANHSSFPTEDVTPNLLRVHGSTCLHCVGIRRTMFAPILALPPYRAMDWAIGQTLHPKHNCYAVYPPLAVQRPGYSTIQGHHVDYTHYFESRGSNR